MADQPKDRLFSVDLGSTSGDFGAPEPVSPEEFISMLQESDAQKPVPPPPHPETHGDKAVAGIFDLLGLLFGLPFGDDLYKGTSIFAIAPFHWLYLIIGIACAGFGHMWPVIKIKAPAMVQQGIPSLARNPLAWLGIVLSIFFYGVGPEMYRRATAPMARQTGSEPTAMVHEPTSTESSPSSPNTPRVYTTKTIADMVASCVGRTALQCDELMADEKGKWINTDGKIQTIWAAGEGSGMLLYNDLARPIQCDFGKKWRDRLNIFKPFDFIKIAGRIGSNQPGPQIYLQECELRE